MQIVPTLPPRLDEILVEFEKTQAKTQEGNELLHKILEARKQYGRGAVADDVNIRDSILMDNKLENLVYQEAYIKYMGLTLYYNDIKDIDAAWFFYARAQHCLGILDSWDRVLNHLICKDKERQGRAKGGKMKNHNNLKLLTDAFIQVAKEQRPPNGWKNKKELINAALPILGPIVDKNGLDSFPLHENLERTAYKWLKNDVDVLIAYAENADPSNDDA